MSRDNKLTILLIEADASLRRLIVLGLQQHGVHVIEASSLDAIPPVDARTLSMLMLDVDYGVRSDWSSVELVLNHPCLSSLPIIILSWDEQPSSLQKVSASTLTRVTYLSKPFDARVLHRKIGQLLIADQAPKEEEAALLAAYNAHTSTSVWPIVTAAGLLVAVIGMMFQIAVTAIGILVVITALLLWTMGPKPEPSQIAIS